MLFLDVPFVLNVTFLDFVPTAFVKVTTTSSTASSSSAVLNIPVGGCANYDDISIAISISDECQNLHALGSVDIWALVMFFAVWFFIVWEVLPLPWYSLATRTFTIVPVHMERPLAALVIISTHLFLC
jgi:hypothetical protein